MQMCFFALGFRNFQQRLKCTRTFNAFSRDETIRWRRPFRPDPLNEIGVYCIDFSLSRSLSLHAVVCGTKNINDETMFKSLQGWSFRSR